MKKIFTLIMTLLLICSSSWASTFTIRVKKEAACTMDLSNGLYLWWWSDVDGNEFVSTTLQDGWWIATITSAASTISCLGVNQNSWGSHQQTVDFNGVTGDICLEIGGSSGTYDIYETSCGEEEFIPASSYHDFSDETTNAQWRFAQDGQVNYWTMGWGADVINPTLYITMDGDAYDYLEGTSSTSWAYIPLILSETDQISFSWKGAGEMNFDYLSVYLFPADSRPYAGSTTVPNDALRLAHNLCESSQWQEVVCTPNVSGAYYLCFMWTNDGSVGSGTPIMIDNLRYGTPEVSVVPTAENLAQYEQDGYFVACINFQGEVCNDIVFAGSYNGWSVLPEDMVHFTPLEGFEGWYVAVVPVTLDNYGAEVNDGKPIQLASDGSFFWDYQTGDAASWELISGSVDVIPGYAGESDLRNWSSAEPVVLRSFNWKNNQSPCGDIVTYDYTINLKAPDCGGYEPAIIGDFNNWVEGVAMTPIGDGWYQMVITSIPGRRVNFRASTFADWSNSILIYDDELGNWLYPADYYLTEETIIYIDYSAGKYTLCEEEIIGRITYDLNGGVTNDYGWMSKSDMWEAFKVDANITSLATLDELKAVGDASLSIICTPLGASQAQTILDNAKWDWLEAYIMKVQHADASATILEEGVSSAGWRYAMAAFFLESKRTSWPVSADFSQAGQDAAYIPTWKHAYANPTEPTGEWVLNAPYKEGYTFDGWYATADFSGDPIVTVSPESMIEGGKLYAKWVEYIPTIAEVFAMEEGVETKISGVVNWVLNTDVFIQDATGGFHLSCSGTKPEVGTKIVAKGTRGSLYGKPTLSGAVIESAESAELATPIVSTLAELLADPLKYFGQRVSVQGVYVAEYNSYGNIYVADIDGANKVQGYYMMPDQSTFPVGTKVSITAVASLHWGTFEFVGDVAGIEKVNAAKKDLYQYPARYDGKYTLTNNWVFSNIEGNFADNMPGSEGYVRGMAAKDGKMYFINRETQSIVVVDGETGEMLASIKISGEHLFEKENEDGTWSSTVTFPFNDIKFDQEGHCLVGALITSPNEHFMIYVVDIETGEADLLFSERLADNPDYADISCRFDAFGVAGDITTDGVIMAADATYGNWLVYRWLIVDGVVQEGEQIDCSIDIDSDHTLFWDQSGFYTASHIFPLDEKGERFYVDGFNTLPMLFDEDGRLIDDFINCPYGTSVNNAEGEILNMNTGHNGLVDFQVGNEYFLLMAAGYTSSSVPSSFALYKFADADCAFSGMEPLWYLPANGMGSATNGCRTAPVAVEVVGNKAYLYLYVNNNGYARYELTVEGVTQEPTEQDYTIRVNKDDVSAMDISNGLYLWWWETNKDGQLATMTLDNDGWYTTTITTTAGSINCLAVNADVVNNGWIGEQTMDYTNITNDICLMIGASDWLYNGNYNFYAVPCTDVEYTSEHNFEDTDANAQWRFVQNGQTNYWTIGSAAGSMDSGSNALYITSDGNNYTYNNNASSTSWAYIPVTVTAVDSITFYWKGKGESDYDNLRVYLFPKGCTPIAGNTDIPNSAIQLGEYLSGQTYWQYFSAMAGVEGEYNLCLRWYNDGSYGEMPIAVDNMAITTPLNTTEYPLTYVLNEDGTATVVKCATDYSGNVSIPTVVTYNGATYTVTSISENAFKECGYLTSVTIPNSVTSIGRMAFAYCWSLESVTLSENISSIEDHTFYDCNSLTSITIPNNVTYVGNYAFGYCHNLSAVTFGDNVTTIDNYAFTACSSLSSVTIPASVSYIGYSTFVSCNSLNSIVVESGNTTYDSRNNCNAIIETASNTLITGCQSTMIPETVTTIGEQAFYDCDGLTTIAIPNSVTSIEYYAFADCDNLSSVDLGDGITTINGSAFEYCYAMTSVTIPASVTEIGSWAFYNCPTIVMEGTTPPTISSYTFKSEAAIFVPCTALDTYLATSVWQDLNLQGSNYTVTLSATEGGSAQITASDCATNTVTIEAYPEERCVFTQWSDGNTDNPRTLTLTEDIALTAEFSLLTYPVTNLVVNTNCGTAYASWESDAPWFEVAAFDANGDYVLYGIVTYKVGVSNSQPFADGEYTWQVTPMYSDIEGDYAGDAIQAPFTISADNCVDLGVYNLNYTINGETVNITWESEAPLYHIWMYDYNYNVLEEKFIDGKNYSVTLSEVGKYHFGIRGNNADATQYSEYSELDIDFVNAEIPYDLNFTNGYVRGFSANNKEVHLFSQDGNTHFRLDLYSDYDNSILGTYIVQDSYNSGDCSIEYSSISYNGITSDSFVSGVVTVMRDNEENYVFSFDITDGIGKSYLNTCTISSEFLTSYNNEDFTGIGVTALTASEALELTQSLEHTDMTTIPYFVSGIISHMRNTPEEIVLYTRARFDISDDGTTNNQFYCYNTKWLNNSDFTTGHEIALGDNVVVYGSLQNYLGTTPEIKGYIYQHYSVGTDIPTPCYTLVVEATEGGYVDISPEAECYDEGSEVILTAVANEGYQFSQWNDDSTENPRILTITEYTTLIAQFSRLTYPVSNLVITTDCGFAHASWISDAPYFETLVFNTNGEVILYGIIDFKENVSNTSALVAGDYIWQVRPMYSTTAGDYAGDAVQQTFTINLDGCVDPEIYDLTYTTTNDSIVNVTWVSEAPLFQVWMYDSFGELLNSEFLNGNNYCDTLSETGVYQFQIRSVDADTMYYTSPAYYLDINITIPETPCYSLNVTANDGGYVIVSPEADCYVEGTEVALTAEAYDGYQFSQWSDGSTDNPRTIVMTEDLSLTAEFTSTSTEEYSFTIRVKKDENSTMDISNGLYIWWWTDDVYEYGLAGTTIDDEGWYTATIITTESTINCLAVNTDVTTNDWDGSQQTVDYEGVVGDICLMIGDIDESDWNNKYSIYPTECVSTSECYTLIVTAEEGGYAYANPSYDCYDEGTEVAVTAVAHTGYKFVSWSDGDTSAQRIVVMTQDYELRASFEVEEQPIVYYTLMVDATEGGSVDVSPQAEQYEEGSQVIVIATSNEGYEFVTWSDGNTSAQRTIVMDKNYSLTATFRSITIPTNNYTITLTCDEGGSVGRAPEQDYYEENATVLIFANANDGYEFVQWSDGNTENIRSIAITQDTLLHATFVAEQKEQFSLTITTDEGGTVTTIPNQETYDAGTIVAVIANANDGYEFVRWSDGITDDVRSVTMTQDIILHATFVAKQKEQYTLNVTAGEGGTVTKTPDQLSYEDGTAVVIAAIANEGYEFVTWSDGNTSAQRTILVDRNYSVTAIFRTINIPIDYYTLILTCDEGGSVTKSPNQEHYEANSIITIVAQPNDGYDFVKWSDGDKNPVRSITMTQNISLHAMFTAEPKAQYIVSVTAGEGGTVTKTPNQELYDEGTIVTIMAHANDGYEFAQWSDGNTNLVRSIVVSQHTILQATFIEKAKEQFTLTITAGEGGTAIKVPNQNYYNAGSMVTIIAQTNDGYAFAQWSDGDKNPVRSITMTQNIALHATFVVEQKEQFMLTLMASEGGVVTKNPDQLSYNAGSVVTISAVAKDGFEFVTWSDGDKNSVRTITMTQNIELKAEFVRTASDYDVKELTVMGSNKRITAKWKSLATRFEIIITDVENNVVNSEKVDLPEDNKVYRYTAPKIATYTVTVKPIDASNQQIGIEASKSVTLVMKYSLFIATENESAGTVNDEVNGDYVEGESVEIVATPKSGYLFKMWDDGDTNAKRTLVMNQDYNLTASFTRIPTHTLTIAEGEFGSASMEVGMYTYLENEVVKLTPIPFDGYVFDHWIINGVEDKNEEITLVMAKDYSVYPVCVPIPVPTYTLTILPGEFGKADMEVGTYTYNEGDKVTLLPIADADYLFAQWVVNGEAISDSILVLEMTKDYEVMPTFKPNQVGVENIYDGITICVEHRTIIIEATQTQDFVLYDLVGHMIEQHPHTREASFIVPSAGLYLVRTNSGIKKVRVE